MWYHIIFSSSIHFITCALYNMDVWIVHQIAYRNLYFYVLSASSRNVKSNKNLINMFIGQSAQIRNLILLLIVFRFFSLFVSFHASKYWYSENYKIIDSLLLFLSHNQVVWCGRPAPLDLRSHQTKATRTTGNGTSHVDIL